MKSISRNTTLMPVASFLFCFGMLFIITSVMFTTVAAQEVENADKITIRHSLPKSVPLKVELIGLDSDDILSNLEVKVTNISNKPIYSLRFGLQTVDVKISGAPLRIWSIEYGRHELNGGANESEEQNIKPTDKFIKPNETVIFKIPKNRVKPHKRNIEIGFYPQPRIYELVFIDLLQSDGTRFGKSGGVVQKKTLKTFELKSCSTSDSDSFFKASDFSLIPLLSPENKTFNFLQNKQVQLQNGQNAPLCPEGCAFSHCERVVEYRTGGCPLPEDPEVEEPYLYINWVFNTTDCGDNCHNLQLFERDCQTEGYTAREYEVGPCSEIPPPPPEGCVPTGHAEGIEGFEYECADEDAQGQPIDNDCNGLANCQVARCEVLSNYCSDACDEDGDQIDNPSCGGNDCDEQSPYRLSIPLKDLDGNLEQESSWYECNDGLDNDCDGKIDYDGKNGRPADDSCPTPTPTPIPTPTPDDGGGGGDDDPCQGDECCGRGTHTECSEGYCEPDVQICEYTYDPYTGLPIPENCVTYPGECEPDLCVEVCN